MAASKIVGAARTKRQTGNNGGSLRASNVGVSSYKAGARVAPRAANDNGETPHEIANDNLQQHRKQKTSVKKLRKPSAAQAIAFANEDAALLLQKARAIRTGWIIISTTLVFWPIQIFFWVMGLGFFGLAITPGINLLEKVPFVNNFTAWSQWFTFSQMLLVTIVGIPSMIYAAFLFTASRVPCFGSAKTIIFILCMTGYFVVFINIIPWAAVWAAFVMLLPDKNNPPDAE